MMGFVFEMLPQSYPYPRPLFFHPPAGGLCHFFPMRLPAGRQGGFLISV